MVLIYRVCYRSLWARTPGVVALVGFLEKKVGVLYAQAGSSCQLAEAMEVFGEEIGFVLALMEYFPIKADIARAIAVGGIGCSCCETTIPPFLNVVYLYCVGLIPVFDFSIDRSYIVQRILRARQLFKIAGKRPAGVKRTVKVDYNHLPVCEILLPIQRKRRRIALIAARVGKQDIVGAVAEREKSVVDKLFVEASEIADMRHEDGGVGLDIVVGCPNVCHGIV